MKKVLFLWALLCLAGTLSAQGYQEFPCDAEPSPEALDYLRRTHQDRLNFADQEESRAVKIVKVAIHIIRTDAGANGISESAVDSRLATANERYKDANIILEPCGPYNYIDDTDYSTFDKYTDETIRTANDVPGAINIYFAKVVQNSSGTICGYAKFPTSSTSSSGTNFTVVDNDCNESSFVHELGHCFGLLHTHSTTSGAELVTRGSGANCATAGDGFCDTPADPKLSSLVTSSCTYTGTATDANGDAYTPDTYNVMSYSYKPCRTNFSASQLSSANYSANNDYVLSRCGAGPVTCSLYLTSGTYNQGFEGAGLPSGWANATDDDKSWSIGSGSTPSTNTGPTTAHGGSNYYYTETSGSTGHPTKTFGLVGPCFNTLNASNSFVSFYYHMYGATIGSLELQLSMDEGNTWETIWTRSGDQGNAWQYQYVTLNSYLNQPSMRLRFWGTSGTSYTGDIAIDDVQIYRNTLGNYAALPYVDGFEGGTFNSYWTTSSTNSFGRIQATSANKPGGEYHAVMDVTTNGNYATNRMDLGLRMYLATDVELSFDWKEFSDENHPEDGVYLSTNSGGTWTKIFDLTGGTSTYQRVTIDISAEASAAGLSLSNNSKIRFQQYDNYSATTDGIAIDNILVTDGSSDLAEIAELQGSLEAAEKAIECFPNPFSGDLHVRIPADFGRVDRLEVYDVTGKAVYRAEHLSDGQTLELGAHFAPGIYMVRIEANGKLEVVKAIKAK